MMKLKDLKGKAVLSTAEAMKVGVVDDIIIDSTYQHIEALVLKMTDRGPERVVTSKKVISIGEDVVTIDSTSSLQTFDEERDLSRLPSASMMQKSRIVTESGKVLGSISDIEFDPTNGQILHYYYDGGPLAEVLGQRHKLDPRHVIKFGPGFVTVTDDALPTSRAA